MYMEILRVKRGIREVREEQSQDMETKIRLHKAKRRKKRIIAVSIVAAVLVIGYLILRYQTYNAVEVLEVYETADLKENVSVQYEDGVVTCSGDGVVFLDKKGRETWNQPCQIKNPIVQVCEGTLLVGDRGGSDILIFSDKGLKGEIHTSRPIEKLTVSAQGIVGAVLTGESAPLVICYDAAGNVLVEHQTSLINTGYPLDIALSRDGKTLLVSYLMADNAVVNTKIVYYYFGEFDKNNTDYVAAQSDYEDQMIPSVMFLDESRSVLVGEQELIFYKGTKNPKSVKTIALDGKIQSVAYGEERVAVILEDEQSGYKVRVYNAKGKEVLSENFEMEYSNIKLVDKHVILYEENRCAIYTEAGVCKYEGEVEMNIEEIFPIAGLNKYMVISSGGLYKIQLVK